MVEIIRRFVGFGVPDMSPLQMSLVRCLVFDCGTALAYAACAINSKSIYSYIYILVII